MNEAKKNSVIGLVVMIFCLSCETQTSETDRERQQQSLTADRGAVMDTSKMEKIEGVPVMAAPGSQIDKSKVESVLEEGNLSFRDIASPRGTVEEIEKSTGKLNQLLTNERVRKDKELQFIVHTMLGNSYLRLHKHSEQNDHRDQAKEHFNSAISLFENQPEYKADLAQPYTGRIGILISEKKYDKAIPEMKYLIEEYQGIGFGPYENWFASHQVEWLHSLTRGDSLKSGKREQIVNYLANTSDKYDNEVGINAEIALARHYLKNDEQSRVKALTESIENRMASLDNPEFTEDNRARVQGYVARIENRKTRSKEQAKRDTVFFEIQTQMIDQARVEKMEMENVTEYFIHVRLKEDYHAKYAQLTGGNIGNFLAVVYDGQIIAPSLPTIQAKIPSGRFQIGPYKKREKAKKVSRQIMGADEMDSEKPA